MSFVALMLATTLAGASAVADEPASDAADMVAASELGAADDAVAAGEALAGDGALAASDAGPAYDGRAASDSASSASGADGALAKQLSLELPLASALGADEPDDLGASATLAGYLSGGMLRVSADVALVAEGEELEPVVGSFTVDGLTYAVTGEGEAALVAVSPRTLAGGLAGGSTGAPSGEGSGSGVSPRSEAEQVPSGATSPSPSSEGASSEEAEGEASASLEGDGPDAADPAALSVPASVEHDGAAYAVTAVGPRAFAGCDAGTVAIPVAVASVDQTAFSGSSVAAVEVAPGNPTYSSYDGMLFDADRHSLLLIPEGKQGAALVPESAEGVLADALSHSGPAEPSSAGGGGAAFSSRNGCLYDESCETLIWAPPGSAEAASLAASDACEADSLPAASLGSAASARSAKDITVTCATDAWVWKDKPSGATSEKSYAMAKGSSRTMDRGTCVFVELLPASSGSSTYAVAGHYQSPGSAQGTVEKSAWRWYLGPGSSSSIAVETGATIAWADGTRQPMLVGEHYLAQPGMRIELHRGVDVKVSLWGKDGSSSSRIEDVYAVNGSAMPAVTPPTRSGYRFMGYYTGASGSGTRYYDATGKSDRTMSQKTELRLYAYWEKIGTVTIFFDPQGATIDNVEGTHTRNVTYADGLTLAAVNWPDWAWAGSSRISRPGYSFKGWFTQPSGGAQVTASSPLPSTSTTYYARWEAKTVWFYMDPNGGAFTNGQTTTLCSAHVTYDPALKLSAGNLQAAVARTGYEFKGWYTAREGGTQVTASSAFPYDYPTYYAQWAARSYDVTFDANDGSVNGAASWTASSPKVTYGLGSWTSVSAATRPGYTFKGWYTARRDGSQVYAPNSKGSTTCTNEGTYWKDNKWCHAGNATFYAQWEERRITIDPNGGFLHGFADHGFDFNVTYQPFSAQWLDYWHAYEDPSHVHYRDLDNHLVILAAARAGYTFAGWDQRVEGESVRLTATWSPNSYTVTLDHAGGSFQGSGSASYPVTVESPAWSSVPGAYRNGYALSGYADAEGNKAYAYDAERSQGAGYPICVAVSGKYWDDKGRWCHPGDATLYAQWQALSYDISYDAAGGELPEGAREGYSTGDAFDLPAPARYGYQFDGWDVAGAQGAGVETVTAEDGSKVTRVKAGTYGDLACTARWTLRYDLDVPVADPGEVTFEADSLTGQVRVRPGTSAEGAILSYMAVPVPLDSLACEGLDASGRPDAAGGAPELEAIFGAGSASQVLFTATVGEGDAPHVARLTAGGASGTASLAGISVPAAASHDAPGRVPVSYGLELDPGLAIPPVRDAAPVARLTWTVSLPAAGA